MWIGTDLTPFGNMGYLGHVRFRLSGMAVSEPLDPSPRSIPRPVQEGRPDAPDAEVVDLGDGRFYLAQAPLNRHQHRYAQNRILGVETLEKEHDRIVLGRLLHGLEHVAVNQVALLRIIELLVQKKIKPVDLKVLLFCMANLKTSTGIVDAMPHEISKKAAVNHSTLKSSLERLCKLGLVYKDDSGYIRIYTSVAAPVSRKKAMVVGSRERRLGLPRSEYTSQIAEKFGHLWQKNKAVNAETEE